MNEGFNVSAAARVLVVDDNATMLASVSRLLSRQVYECRADYYVDAIRAERTLHSNGKSAIGWESGALHRTGRRSCNCFGEVRMFLAPMRHQRLVGGLARLSRAFQFFPLELE